MDAFDSTLRNFTMVVDSGSGTGMTAFRTAGLIPYIGDSTLMPDFGASALIVLDPTGKQIRSMAPPHASDLTFIGVPSAFGHPAVDAKGRLVYRSGFQIATQTAPDTSPIVRGDFDTRTVDTLGWLKSVAPERMDMERKPDPSGTPSMLLRISLDPFATPDQWAMLSDGTVAIVRVHDYHVDWIDPDGARRSTAKMPIDWRRYTDVEKQQLVDSARRVADEQTRKVLSGSGRGGGPQIRVEIKIVPDSEFPSFWPPIEPGSVLADLDAHLWILPTTSTNSANGFTYDVVDRTGKVFERVQLPKGHVLVGFGPHNVVYLSRADGTSTCLERALLTGPPR